MVADAKATELSGVVVTAKPKAVPLSGVEVVDSVRCLPPRNPPDDAAPAPRLVSTYPGDGQTVQPGFVVLRLTFDLPMACRASLGKALRSACALTGKQTWHQSYDRRTLLIVCKLQAQASYTLSINRIADQERFQGLSGREAIASDVTFATSKAPPVMSVADTLGRDPALAALIKR
jgi:hypothetical protein